MTKKELNQLSKDALEELGRTKGVELDKRFTKPKLVEEIFSLFKKEKKVTTESSTTALPKKYNLREYYKTHEKVPPSE